MKTAGATGLCPKDPIRSHLCDRGNPYGGPWSKEEGGQGAVPRLLPATEHRAWAGAHAPGALLPRASWTTGAWAPSSRGLFGMSRQLAGPDIKVVGPPRPVSVRSGTRPGSPRPSQRARRASQASLGKSGFAGCGFSRCITCVRRRRLAEQRAERRGSFKNQSSKNTGTHAWCKG